MLGKNPVEKQQQERYCNGEGCHGMLSLAPPARCIHELILALIHVVLALHGLVVDDHDLLLLFGDEVGEARQQLRCPPCSVPPSGPPPDRSVGRTRGARPCPGAGNCSALLPPLHRQPAGVVWAVVAWVESRGWADAEAIVASPLAPAPAAQCTTGPTEEAADACRSPPPT